jgi:hypothetical protein
VRARTSIPASRAIKNGMNPAGDQSLSKIAYRFSVVFLALRGDAEMEVVMERTRLSVLRNCIFLIVGRGERGRSKKSGKIEIEEKENLGFLYLHK